MPKLEGKMFKAFKSDAYPKFLATVDAAGMPNVVPVLTLRAVDDETLGFARMMVWKTAKNLETVKKAAVCCFGPGGSYYRVRAEFVEFAKSGKYNDLFNNLSLFRYNAYAGASEIGVLKIVEILPPRKVGWAKKIFEMRKVRKAAHSLGKVNGGPMPPPVVEHFDKGAAVKYIAFTTKEGWPELQPVFSLFPAGDDKILFRGDADLLPEKGAPIAASSITHQLIAYQVKGIYEGRQTLSGIDADTINVKEVFSAGPPLPGKRVYPPEY